MSKEIEKVQKLHKEYESLLLDPSDTTIFSGPDVDVIDNLEYRCNLVLNLADRAIKLARKYARRLS